MSEPGKNNDNNKNKDCLACKIIGFIAFGGAGSYALYTQYDINQVKYPSINLVNSIKKGPHWLTIVAAGFYSLAVYRIVK